MKTFVISSVFLLTTLIGVILSDSSHVSAKLENHFHADCARWDHEILEKPLFTLNEAKSLLRKKVISNDENFRKGETGRIIHIEMVGQNKFLIAIYWENKKGEEESSLTFHDKQWFTMDFEVVD